MADRLHLRAPPFDARHIDPRRGLAKQNRANEISSLNETLTHLNNAANYPKKQENLCFVMCTWKRSHEYKICFGQKGPGKFCDPDSIVCSVVDLASKASFAKGQILKAKTIHFDKIFTNLKSVNPVNTITIGKDKNIGSAATINRIVSCTANQTVIIGSTAKAITPCTTFQ